MPELRRAADAGDPAAACKLAYELSGCTEVQQFELGAFTGDRIQDSPEQPLSTVAAHHSRCSTATEADLLDRYRYHAQAFESGDPAAQRSFVQTPLLDNDDFLINSPNAIAFRRRGQAYVARALQRKGVEDLKVLLEVYMPPSNGQSMSKLRIRDDAMFLALVDAAQQSNVADARVRGIAARVRSQAAPGVLAQATQRASQVSGQWRSTATSGMDTPAGAEPCGGLKRI